MENIARIILFLMGLAAFSLGAIQLASKGDESISAMFFGVGIMLLIFTYLSRFKKIKGFGIEAELWEEQQIEAKEIIEKLQSISPALAACSYSALGGIGRFAGAISSQERFRMATELSTQLNRIGVSEDEIRTIRSNFDRLMLIDLSQPIWNAMRGQLTGYQKEIQNELNLIPQPRNMNDPAYIDITKRRLEISKEIKRMDVSRQNYNKDYSDIIEILEAFWNSSEYFNAQSIQNLREKFNIHIKNIIAFTARREIIDPNVVLND